MNRKIIAALLSLTILFSTLCIGVNASYNSPGVCIGYVDGTREES